MLTVFAFISILHVFGQIHNINKGVESNLQKFKAATLCALGLKKAAEFQVCVQRQLENNNMLTYSLQLSRTTTCSIQTQ